jgi:hypothetical protein
MRWPRESLRLACLASKQQSRTQGYNSKSPGFQVLLNHGSERLEFLQHRFLLDEERRAQQSDCSSDGISLAGLSRKRILGYSTLYGSDSLCRNFLHQGFGPWGPNGATRTVQH